MESARPLDAEMLMRAVFSLCGLLLVLFLVAKLSGVQLGALTGLAGSRAPAEAASAAPRATAAERAAAQVTRVMEQGAAQRADDAASR